MASVYNHRSLTDHRSLTTAPSSISIPSASAPGPPSATVPGSAGGRPENTLATATTRVLTENFDVIKNEFEILSSEVTAGKRVRDELEAKVTSQVNELNLIRQSLYELESTNFKLRQKYEDELRRGKASLASFQAGEQRERERERDRDRDRDRDRERDRDRKPMSDPYYTPRSDRDRGRERDRERTLTSSSGRERDRLPPPHLSPEREHTEREPKRMRFSPPLSAGGALGLIPNLPPHPGSSSGAHSNSASLLRSPVGPGSGMSRRPTNGVPMDVSPSTTLSTTSSSSANGSIIAAAKAVVLGDLDLTQLPPELTRGGDGTIPPASGPSQVEGRQPGGEWHCVFNPVLYGRDGRGLNGNKRPPDVRLVWNFVHPTVVCCVQFSADGKFLATGCNRTAQVFDVTTGSLVCTLQDHSAPTTGDLYIRAVRFSPDGSMLATGAEDQLVRIYSIPAQRIITTFSGHSQEIYALDFSADGRYIASGSGDKTVRVWDLRPFLSAGGSPPDSPRPGSSSECIILTAEPIVDDTPDAPGITSISLSPSSNYVASGSLDSLVRIYRTFTGELVEVLEGHGNSVYSVMWTPDGDGVVSGSLDKGVRVWDVSHLGEGSSPAGRGKGKCIMEFTGHKDYVLSVSIPPARGTDGGPQPQYIVSGSKDRGIQFWDPKTGVPAALLMGHRNSVISIHLNPNPKMNLLASGSGDNFARVWSY